MIKSHLNNESTSTNELAPDLTPMLDILFIMLVFFMLTTGAVLQSLELELPSSVEEKIELLNKPKHIMLEIRKESYSLDGKFINNFSTLRADTPRIIKEKPGHELIVAGDKDISMERLLKVLTYLQSQGINAANILMQHENEK